MVVVERRAPGASSQRGSVVDSAGFDPTPQLIQVVGVERAAHGHLLERAELGVGDGEAPRPAKYLPNDLREYLGR